MKRNELLARLRTESFDLLIIGGGIVGAGMARDAAMRGLKVALVEKGDFASGTSSKTSKLIHGGLRYLEHGQLRLVFESLRERQILRAIAPELVWPLTLMIPLYRGDARPRWKIEVGLTLYDLLALHRHIPARPDAQGTGGRAHQLYSSRATLRVEPKLQAEGLSGAGMYSDCQMDDARLCLATILQAVNFGAVCCNYARALSLTKASGALCGAVVEDERTSEQFGVKASVVVNATGPWSDAIRRMSDPHAGTRLAPTKGIHLIVPRLSPQALFAQSRPDGRMIFLLPWSGYTLVGTTESADVEKLDELHATASEVDYLLAEANRLFPDAKLRASSIIATYAGARPLLAFGGSATSASREHAIEVDRFGLVSVMGGKYTTHRLMAKQALDLIAQRFSLRTERCLTDQITLLEPTHPVVLNRWQDVTRRIDPELLARLLTRYGTGAFRILELLEFEPHLVEAVCPHHDLIQAELVYGMQEELACTVSDLLVRRTRIAHSSCQGLDLLSMLKDVLMRYSHLSSHELEEQILAYQRFLEESGSFRPASARALTEKERRVKIAA